MKKAIIFGGAGFLGIELAKKLKGKYDVSIFDLEKPRIKGVKSVLGDITNYSEVEEVISKGDLVFNLASLLPCSRAGDNFMKVNVGGTENIMKVSLKNEAEKVIHVSSSIVYGIPEKTPCDEKGETKPIGNYGKSKLMAEKICLRYMKKGVKATIIRPRFIVGKGRAGLLTILFDWIKRGKRIYLIGDGKNKFQMVSVYDVADACIKSISRGDAEIINIANETTPVVYELIANLVKHAKSKSRITPINSFLARISLKTLDLFGLTPLNIEHYMVADKEYVLSTEKARKILGWKPKYNVQDMLSEGYDWYIKNEKEIKKMSEQNFPKQKFLKILRFFS